MCMHSGPALGAWGWLVGLFFRISALLLQTQTGLVLSVMTAFILYLEQQEENLSKPR